MSSAMTNRKTPIRPLCAIPCPFAPSLDPGPRPGVARAACDASSASFHSRSYSKSLRRISNA